MYWGNLRLKKWAARSCDFLEKRLKIHIQGIKKINMIVTEQNTEYSYNAKLVIVKYSYILVSKVTFQSDGISFSVY